VDGFRLARSDVLGRLPSFGPRPRGLCGTPQLSTTRRLGSLAFLITVLRSLAETCPLDFTASAPGQPPRRGCRRRDQSVGQSGVFRSGASADWAICLRGVKAWKPCLVIQGDRTNFAVPGRGEAIWLFCLLINYVQERFACIIRPSPAVIFSVRVENSLQSNSVSATLAHLVQCLFCLLSNFFFLDSAVHSKNVDPQPSQRVQVSQQHNQCGGFAAYCNAGMLILRP